MLNFISPYNQKLDSILAEDNKDLEWLFGDDHAPGSLWVSYVQKAYLSYPEGEMSRW